MLTNSALVTQLLSYPCISHANHISFHQRAALHPLPAQVLGRLSAESCALLDALGASLHELTGLTAPIHCRATALTQAQRNISAANAAVDELLDNLDTSRRVRLLGAVIGCRTSSCCRVAGSR